MLKFKNAIVVLVGLLFLLGGCAGISLFPNQAPFCTPDEQLTSLVYKYTDPATADFVLLLGTATFLDKHPEDVDILIKVVEEAKNVVENGTTYDIFASVIVDLLGPLQYVVVSPLLGSFKGVEIPLTECDEKLILGHLDKQLKLAQMVK